MTRLALAVGISLALGCGDPVTPSGGGPGSIALQACPTTGPGGVVASAGRCWVFSPASAGASALGQNAGRLNYALEPSGSARSTLVVLLNGSGSTPAELTFDPAQNLFVAAAASGNHVLAIAYRSDVAVVTMCGSRPECYGGSRSTLVNGVFAPDADSSLTNIREDEGIIARIDQAIRALVVARPNGGWGSFIATATAPAASDRIAWPRVIASGHSQGGGHAAYMAKQFPLMRVVQFSSTCDAAAGVPAPWTAAGSGWAASPATIFFGFSAPTIFTDGVPTGGDLNCPYHLAVWQNMGMPQSRQTDDAATCGINPHPAAIVCTANYQRWVALFR